MIGNGLPSEAQHDSGTPLTRTQRIWKTRREKYGAKGAARFRERTPAKDRMWKYISPEPNSGCWLWTGAVDGKGYGLIKETKGIGQTRRAHIVAYEAEHGQVPNGLVLDHLCRVTCCVNPAHLEAVTPRENIRRGNVGDNSRVKTHCPAGHPYDQVNTTVNAQGHRSCKICRKASSDRFIARQKEKQT